MREFAPVTQTTQAGNDLVSTLEDLEFLQNNKQRWDLLTSLMIDGFIVVRDQLFFYANQAFAEMVGLDPNELIGRNFIDFVALEQRPILLERYQRRMSGQQEPTEYRTRVLHTDGCTEIDVKVQLDVVYSGSKPIAVTATIRDQRKLISVQNQLQQAEDKLSSILNNINDAIYQTNMEGVVTYISNSVERLLGYNEKEFLGTRLADYYWNPEERQKVVDAIIKGKGTITNVEAILRHKNGRPVWISTNAYVKHNEQGQAVSIEGMARDVTAQKEMQQKLYEYESTRHLELAPGMIEFAEFKRQLRNSLKARQGFFLSLFRLNSPNPTLYKQQWSQLVENCSALQLGSDSISRNEEGDTLILSAQSNWQLLRHGLEKLKLDYREQFLSLVQTQLQQQDHTEFALFDRLFSQLDQHREVLEPPTRCVFL